MTFSTSHASESTDLFMKMIHERHSGRDYNPDKEISPENLQMLIEAARWTPSCYGEEPWRFLICSKTSSANQNSGYTKVLNALAPANQKWAAQAPVLIVVLADTLFSREDKGENRWGSYDTGAAAQTMILAGHAHGLMIHPMGGFDATQITEVFQIPARFQVMAVMALGYEAKASSEPKPRKRQPITTRFFFESWPQS